MSFNNSKDDKEYEDYYKKYKRSLREANRKKNKGFYIKSLIALLLISGTLAFIIVSMQNSESQGNVVSKENTPENSTSKNEVKDQTDTINNNTEQKPSETTDSNTSYNSASNQNNNSTSSSTKRQDKDNDAERQKLLDEIAKSEGEKQRIAKEQAAAQLEQKCNSIKNDMNSSIKNAQVSYNTTVQNISCPSFGGCPARDTAKTNYERTVNTIKTSHQAEWEKAGCAGSIY